jgi:hypothetical protein
MFGRPITASTIAVNRSNVSGAARVGIESAGFLARSTAHVERFGVEGPAAIQKRSANSAKKPRNSLPDSKLAGKNRAPARIINQSIENRTEIFMKTG